MKKFKHITVLSGGISAEREVSLASGRAVSDGLRASGYEVQAVDVTSNTLPLPSRVDAVFIALHGTFGEDGQVQALLRERAVPYTGSGEEACRLSFDKLASKKVFQEANLPTPSFEIIGPSGQRTLPLPVVVKPARQGSSVGIHRVFNEEEWTDAWRDAAQYDACVIAETYIPGKELTVGIVGDLALPALQICAPDDYYDYRAKYTKGVTQYLVPAPITSACAEECERRALQAFAALGCRSMARVDFRMNPEGDLFILEVNTIPGFTATSLLPKAALATGIEFPELCASIIEMADVH